MPHKKGLESGPVIFRDCSHELMKAITVYLGKTCKYKTITPELMLFIVQVIADMCEGGYRNRNHNIPREV